MIHILIRNLVHRSIISKTNTVRCFETSANQKVPHSPECTYTRMYIIGESEQPSNQRGISITYHSMSFHTDEYEAVHVAFDFRFNRSRPRVVHFARRKTTNCLRLYRVTHDLFTHFELRLFPIVHGQTMNP